MSSPATIDTVLCAFQTADWSESFLMFEGGPGQPMDLTDCSVRFQLLPQMGGGSTRSLTLTSDPDEGVVLVENADDILNTIVVTATMEQLALLPPMTYLLRLRITSPGGFRDMTVTGLLQLEAR